MVYNVQFTLSGNIHAIYKPAYIQAPAQFAMKPSAGRWVFKGFSERRKCREAVLRSPKAGLEAVVVIL